MTPRSRKWLIAAVIAGGLFLIARKGFSMGDDILQYLDPTWKANRNQAQLDNMTTIAQAFAENGLSVRAAAAAIVNAWAESRLHEKAAGDGGHSIGLFQLNDHGGAGVGYSVGYREDPANNVQIMLKAEVMASRGKKFRDADAAGASVADLTRIFCYDLERPANKTAVADTRANSAKDLFPDL